MTVTLARHADHTSVTVTLARHADHTSVTVTLARHAPPTRAHAFDAGTRGTGLALVFLGVVNVHVCHV